MSIKLRVFAALAMTVALAASTGCGGDEMANSGSGSNVAPPSKVEKD